jgi:hypothetical protein
VKAAEESEGADQGVRVEAASNCAYVDWCDKPNSSFKTVCGLKGSCIYQVALAECKREAKDICGKVFEPLGVFVY